MLTRTLGGDTGRRALFGRRRDRTRTLALLAVTAGGMAATILWRLPGLIAACATGAVVYAATALTPNGSLSPRLVARWRWARRTGTGELTFIPAHVPQLLPAPRTGSLGRSVVQA